jgi:hypothetical protein
MIINKIDIDIPSSMTSHVVTLEDNFKNVFIAFMRTLGVLCTLKVHWVIIIFMPIESCFGTSPDRWSSRPSVRVTISNLEIKYDQLALCVR